MYIKRNPEETLNLTPSRPHQTKGKGGGEQAVLSKRNKDKWEPLTCVTAVMPTP